MSFLTCFTRAVLSSWLVAIWKRRLKSSARASLSFAVQSHRQKVHESLLAFIYSCPSVSARNDLALDGQLVDGQTQGLLGGLLVDAVDLEHDAAGLHDGDPRLGVALAGTHAGLGRLLRDGLVGEDGDPHLAATLHVTGHGDTSSLDLAVRDPVRPPGPGCPRSRGSGAVPPLALPFMEPRCTLRCLTRLGTSIYFAPLSLRSLRRERFGRELPSSAGWGAFWPGSISPWYTHTCTPMEPMVVAAVAKP